MSTRWFLLFCLLTVFREIVVPVSSTSLKSLDVAHEWKYIDYDFNSDAHRQVAIESGDYDYKNCVPRDMDRWNDKTFVTVMNDYGVPATLTVVTNKTGPGGPLLRPYPDWSWADNKNCSGITSAYAIAIDMCDRLWVIDAGLFADMQICRPRLLIFDLPTSTLLGDIEIPEDTSTSRSSMYGWLTNIVVKTSGLDCTNTTAYISDTMGAGLIVYNGGHMLRLNSWDLDHDSDAAVQSAEKQSRKMECGIAAMGLSSLTQNLYFTALFSRALGVANTDRNDDGSTCRNLQFDAFANMFGTEPTALAVSKTGAVFFGLADDASIACWSEYRSLKINNIKVISRDCATLQFISSMKVKHFYPEEQLWVFSNRYHKNAGRGYNFNETNFRIHRRDVNDLIGGTCCTPINNYLHC